MPCTRRDWCAEQLRNSLWLKHQPAWSEVAIRNRHRALASHTKLHACEKTACICGSFIERVLVATVAAEEFVAAVTTECNCHELPSESREQQSGEARRIAIGFIETRRDVRQHSHRIRGEHIVAMVGAEHARGVSREEMLGRVRVVEAHRKRVDLLPEVLRHDCDDERTVNAAREERTERNIALESLFHRTTYQSAEFVLCFGRRATCFDRLFRVEVIEVQRSTLLALEVEEHRSAWREFAQPFVHTKVAWHVLHQQVRRNRVTRDSAIQERQLLKRAQFACESEESIALREVEGLLAEGVAREHEFALSRVPRSQGKHAVEFLALPERSVFKHVHEHFGVAVGSKAVPLRLKFRAQFVVVVDLTVEDDMHRLIFIRHRLPTLRPKVDDGQPSMREGDAPILGDPGGSIVGASMHHGFTHGCREAFEFVSAEAKSSVKNSGDATHASRRVRTPSQRVEPARGTLSAMATPVLDVQPTDAKGTDESLRFGFGGNWSQFIAQHFDESRVESSRQHLLKALRVESLTGKSFLDIGCGSGLHSLAALRANAATVVGFDFDRDAVETSAKVREMAAQNDARWTVEQGSVLDRARMASMPKFDIVYSWGVLHHTGDLWTAMDNAIIPRKPDGVVYLALYSSDQYVEPPTGEWVKVKRRYNECGAIGKRVMEWKHAGKLFKQGLRDKKWPWRVVQDYNTRGMDFWTDIKDWLGGWPIEFASYREVEQWGARHGLRIVNAIVGEGCTEYLLADPTQNHQWSAEEARRLASRKPLPTPFTQRDGLSWTAQLPELVGACDQCLSPRGSRLMLYDGDVPMGLTHFMHAHIASYGAGRFAHWQDYVMFSTRDGSDPNTDPARYSFVAEY